MAKLTVYGASDDLVETSGIDGTDEFDITSESSWSAVIQAPSGETAMLYVDLRRNGCWTVSLGRYEEDYALPSWPVSVISDDSICRYSTYAEIIVPDGSTLTETPRR
jgi:hypothetical protein